MRVGETVGPVTCIVVTGFQTALRRRFPFIIRFNLNTVLLAGTVLILIRRVGTFDLCVVGEHVKTEVVIRSADVQFMLIHLKLIVQRHVTTGVGNSTGLITGISAVIDRIQHINIGVFPMVGVSTFEHLRITNHSKTGYADRMTFCYVEIQAATSKDTTAFMALCSFLREVTLYQRRI